MSDLSPAAHPVPACPPLFSGRRKAAFCESLSHSGNVRLACRAAGVSPQTAYRARRASADFRACWDAALVLARSHAEAVLADRALNGVEEAVFYHGEEVATRRRYDTRLLLAHLARLDRLADAVEARGVEMECAAEDGREDACDGEEGGGFDAALDALARGLPVAGKGGALAPRARSAPTLSAAPPPAGRGDPTAEEDEEDDALPAFERRLRAMEAARPEDAPPMRNLGEVGEVEAVQLAAFEAGDPEWWRAAPEPEVLIY